MQSLRVVYGPVRRAVNWYKTVLRKKYPKLYDLQNSVIIGTKSTFTEGKDYVVATTRYLTGKPLSYKDVFLRWQYPRDLLKLSPVILLLMIPFSSVALLPFVYYFPGIFTRHFWTEDQRGKFTTREIGRRLAVVPDLLHQLDAKIPKLQSDYERELLRFVLNQVKDERIISPPDLKALQPIFGRFPFALEYLPSDHLWNLAFLNRLFPWSMDRYATQLSQMDQLLAENGLSAFGEQDIRQAALIRCANPNGQMEDLQDFLEIWITASSSVAETAHSLRLHFPLFFSNCHPINRECRPH